MKCSVACDVALVLSTAIAVHAYPGGQQPRASATSASKSNSSGVTLASEPPNATSSSSSSHAQHFIASGPTTTIVFASPSASFLSLSSPSATANRLQERHHSPLPLHSSLLGLLSDDAGVAEEDDEEDDCESEEEDNDDEQLLHTRREGHHGEDEGCSSALHAVLAQLQEIRATMAGNGKALVQAPSQEPTTAPEQPSEQRRQVNDALSQEQAYGDQGKDLTQEQREALEALVKGVNGYQGSVDGATDTAQTDEEATQQTTSAVQSASHLSDANPSQLQQLLALLELVQSQKKPAKPSMTGIGSQAGQAVSEASWIAPASQSAGQEAGSTVRSKGATAKENADTASDSTSFVLLARLKDLKQQEKLLLEQMQSTGNRIPVGRYQDTPNSSMSHGNRLLTDVEAPDHEGQTWYQLSDEEMDEVTAMVLDEKAKAASQSTTPSTVKPMIISANHTQRREQQSSRSEADRAGEQGSNAMAVKALANGGFDSTRLASALATQAASQRARENVLSQLLDELPPSLQLQVLRQLRHQSWQSMP